jgi:mRNA interferase HigB
MRSPRKMKIIGLSTLKDFSDEHVDCRKWISNWVADVKQSNWRNGHDIRERYATASFLRHNIVIFNVRGNRYRLVTTIAFINGVVSVKWIGTHDEYDRIDW